MKNSIKWILFDFIAEIVCSLFVFNELQNAYTDQRGNIIEVWRNLDRYDVSRSKQQSFGEAFTSYFDLARRKLLGMKPKDAIMAERLEYLYVYCRTIILLALSLTFVYLFFKIVFRLYRNSIPEKVTAISKPPVFKKNMNVNLWLDMFEIYLAEENIRSNKYKCICLMSNLDMEFLQLIKFYNDNVVNDYDKLVTTMRNLFAVDEKTSVEAQLEFSNRQQKSGENIHQYYASLMKSSYDAFGNLTRDQRLENVGKRFIAGLEPSYDNLRCKLLETYDDKSTKKKNWKEIIEVADKFKSIYAQKQLKINVIKTRCEHVQVVNSNSNTRVRCLECNPIVKPIRKNKFSKNESPKCYNCLERGHIRAFCPLKNVDGKTLINKRLQII